MRIDKTKSVDFVKKCIQKFLIKLWSRMLKGEDKLYIIDEINIKTRQDNDGDLKEID